MIGIKKILLTFLSLIVVLFLSYYSFFIKDINSINYPEFKNIETGFSSGQIEINGDFIDKYNLKINILDEIISSTNNIEIKEKNINIGTGVFLIDIIDSNAKYNIINDYYIIETIGETKLLIINKEKYVSIFSQNSQIKLDFLGLDKKSLLNTSYIYPHGYIKFNPLFNKNLESKDIKSIESLTSLGFFQDEIFKDGVISDEFLNKIAGTEEDKKNIIKAFYKNIFDKNKNYSENINNLKKINISDIIYNKYIKNYNYLFINDSKKNIYLKNLLINDLKILEKSSKKDSGLISNIESNLLLLKKVNKKDYDYAKNIIDIYIKSIVYSFENNEIKKINFLNLWNKIENRNITVKESIKSKISDIYIKYDYENTYLFTNLSQLIKNLKLELDENEYIYFSNYINKLTSYGLDKLSDKSNNININDIIEIFYTYIDVSIKYYSIDDKEKLTDSEKNSIVRTGISEYSITLNKLITQIENNYFLELEKDNEEGLIILNEENTKNYRNILKLEENIKSIFEYFEKNKKYIGNRNIDDDKKIIDDFEEYKYKIKKYLTAIDNYEEYKINYIESTKQALLDDIEEDDIYIYSNQKAINYFKTFGKIYINSIKSKIRGYNYCELSIEEYDLDDIEKEYCYIIELKNNDNQLIKFSYDPLNGNKLYNISINKGGVVSVKNGSYILDELEEVIEGENEKKKDLAEKYEIKSIKNFFYDYFVEQNISNDNNNIDENIKEEINNKQESELSLIFKRSKLLGNSGVFLDLEGFIDILFNNIYVTESKTGFDVQVTGSEINIGKYNGTFDGKYIQKGNFFKDIVLNLDLKSIENKNIKLIGELELDNMEDDFLKITESINKIESNYEKVKEIFFPEEILFDYNNSEQILKNDNFEIKIKGIFVTSLKLNNQEILMKTIHIDKLKNNLDN